MEMKVNTVERNMLVRCISLFIGESNVSDEECGYMFVEKSVEVVMVEMFEGKRWGWGGLGFGVGVEREVAGR
mgnify:CR=1 FL=1